MLKDRGVRYIAALKPDRFRILTNLLKQQVNNTGYSSWAWNEARGELQCITSLVTRVLERNLLCPTALLRHPTKMRHHEVQYKVMFYGYDTFNRQLHNRTFPDALPRDTNLAVEKNI